RLILPHTHTHTHTQTLCVYLSVNHTHVDRHKHTHIHTHTHTHTHTVCITLSESFLFSSVTANFRSRQASHFKKLQKASQAQEHYVFFCTLHTSSTRSLFTFHFPPGH